MKELYLLSIFFCFGFGNENAAVHELSDIKAKLERKLTLVKAFNNKSISELPDLFSELPEKCTDVKVLDDYYSTEMKKITLPMIDWISQASIQIRDLEAYLSHFLSQDFSHHDSGLPTLIVNSFYGDCHFSFPNERPRKIINTNDIYAFQNNINCEKEDSKKFECGSGECIDFNRTCDGKLDCWDGSDEFGACEEKVLCEGCSEFCVRGPRGPKCVAECPAGFKYSRTNCPLFEPCYSLCLPKSRRRTISAKCLDRIFYNLLETTVEHYYEFMPNFYVRYSQLSMKCRKDENSFKEKKYLITKDSLEEQTTTFPTWHTTTRHPTRHPTSRHPTWHTTTRHPTWHPTSRHPTWHTTTRHPTWHPTSRHPTWHPTTRHPTWHPTTRHPTWHPTTRHPTWPTTSQSSLWNSTTIDSVWSSTISDYSTQIDEKKHHTTKHTTPHSTTHHTKRTTRHHTTKHTTPHSTTHHTKHTTKHHTTKHTTHHTTTPITTTTPTTPHTTTTPTKSTTPPITTTNADGLHVIILQ